MTVNELYIQLGKYAEDTLFDYNYNLVEDLKDVLVTYNFRAKECSTVKRIKKELEILNCNMDIEIDIDEGYLSSPVIRVRYSDAENNKLTFISECYK